MALGRIQIRGTCRRFKPHLFMIIVQLCYTFNYFIVEASFNQGFNPQVYLTYRHIVATLFMCPFAYFHERKLRPKLTWALFLEINVFSILGASLTLNLYFESLVYASPTFIASMLNTTASMTFVIAILLRLEHLDLWSPRGAAKAAGTVVSLAGVTVMTLYKGPATRNLWGALIHAHGNAIHKNWVKGAILTVASCIGFSSFYIMQAMTLKRYPAPLSLTTWMCFLGAAQSAVFAAFVQQKPAAWMIGFDLRLWSILYSGAICSGLVVYLQLWCTEEKGPVFVTMFNPLCTIMVAVLAYFVFGEKIFLGSFIGGILVIVGLYSLLWGKEKDEEVEIKRYEEDSFVANGKENAGADASSDTGGKADQRKGTGTEEV